MRVFAARGCEPAARSSDHARGGARTASDRQGEAAAHFAPPGELLALQRVIESRPLSAAEAFAQREQAARSEHRLAAIPASQPGGHPAPVQRRQLEHGHEDLVQAAARQGTRGAGGPLPHLDTIQRSFGRHDLSPVVAHLDGAAATASQAIGAAAFTMGEHIAFGGPPDLHTAAHEAAHAIQQRQGVDIPGGVGSAGDRHERSADAVADLVVQGRSAESLLGPPVAALRPRPLPVAAPVQGKFIVNLPDPKTPEVDLDDYLGYQSFLIWATVTFDIARLRAVLNDIQKRDPRRSEIAMLEERLEAAQPSEQQQKQSEDVPAPEPLFQLDRLRVDADSDHQIAVSGESLKLTLKGIDGSARLKLSEHLPFNAKWTFGFIQSVDSCYWIATYEHGTVQITFSKLPISDSRTAMAVPWGRADGLTIAKSTDGYGPGETVNVTWSDHAQWAQPLERERLGKLVRLEMHTTWSLYPALEHAGGYRALGKVRWESGAMVEKVSEAFAITGRIFQIVPSAAPGEIPPEILKGPVANEGTILKETLNS